MSLEREMLTSIELPVNQDTYDKIVNFCEDFGIDEVPRRSNMFFQAGCFIGVHKIDIDNSGITYLMGDLELEVIESITEGNILMAWGESPALESLSYKYDSMVGDDIESCIEEPIYGIVISSMYDGDKDIGMLNSKLNEYLDGRVAFDNIRIRYATSEEMHDYILDGKDPE